MSRKKKAKTIVVSPAMSSLVRQIEDTKRAIAKLKKDTRKVVNLQKRKTGKNKKSPSFLEVMQKYAVLERRALKIMRGILKNDR